MLWKSSTLSKEGKAHRCAVSQHWAPYHGAQGIEKCVAICCRPVPLLGVDRPRGPAHPDDRAEPGHNWALGHGPAVASDDLAVVQHVGAVVAAVLQTTTTDAALECYITIALWTGALFGHRQSL